MKANLQAWLFPGQGSQKVGMGVELLAASPEARHLFQQANDILGYDLAELCLKGPQERLDDTRQAQPALLTLDVAYAAHSRARGRRPAMLAGHSLGEYAALVAAGVLEFEVALRLVVRRAALMAAAPPGAMAAIIALPDERLQAVLDAGNEVGLVVLANDNAPGQVVLSGEKEALRRATETAKACGAKMTVTLPVSGAFHSPLLSAAAAELEEIIKATAFAPPEVAVYCNVTAAATLQATELQAALQQQMTHRVRWRETVTAMVGAGASRFFEMGPGTVLAGLGKRIDKTVPVLEAPLE